MVAIELSEDLVSAGAVAWMLTSTALVFIMTTGLSLFYGGLVRDTNIINTMMMSFVSMGIVTVIWVAIGFSLAFGRNGPFIGNLDYVFLMNLDMSMWEGTNLPGLCYACFQMAFAILSSAIISGSLVERMNFNAYVVMLALWAVLVHAPLCHWVWAADGWIRTLGALDFAGGTVIHISAGVSGYVASAIVGPRRNSAQELGPANVPFVLLGASLMWFGWLGFAGGSALSSKNGLAPRAVTATLTAAASSMLSWIVMERMVKGKASSVGAAIGAVVGLICISPGAGYVTPGCSMAFGAIGGPWCYLCVAVFNRMSIDDTLDSMGLHGMGGIAGSILTGVFAMNHGLIYEGTFTLLGKQMAGVFATVAFSAVGTAAIVLCIKIFMPLRVTEEREITGVDEEHTRGAMFKHKASAPPSSNDLEDCDSESSDSLDPV